LTVATRLHETALSLGQEALAMRAVRFDTFGEPADVLTVASDLPAPQPGPGEVRLRLTHRTVNPSDLATIRGVYGIRPPLPATPGYEGVGVVEALGAGVNGLALGQRVIPLSAGGTWQEQVVARASLVLPVHDGVGDEAAAQFVVNPVTAWVMLTDVLRLREGDWVLQTAAGSTLGRLVIQLAKELGLRTVNLVRREEQRAELLALGADEVLCDDDPDLPERVRALTGGGVDGAIDAVGGKTGKQAIACLERGATCVVYGWLSLRPIALDVSQMLFRNLTVRGFWLSTWFRERPPEVTREVLSRLMALMVDGALVPPVEARYDLAEVAAAVAHAERPGRSGKVLLTG
jgi:NADPH:quinone reductase-like Zn-dependent oxidoreductase